MFSLLILFYCLSARPGVLNLCRFNIEMRLVKKGTALLSTMLLRFLSLLFSQEKRFELQRGSSLSILFQPPKRSNEECPYQRETLHLTSNVDSCAITLVKIANGKRSQYVLSDRVRLENLFLFHRFNNKF